MIAGLTDNRFEASISFHEFALYLQAATPDVGLKNVLERIAHFRECREKQKGQMTAFYRTLYDKVADREHCKRQTLDDYADLSLRYLKATGLFRTAGRTITLSPARAHLAALLKGEPEESILDGEYLKGVWIGVHLPTDDPKSSYSVLSDLAKKLQKRGVKVDMPSKEADLPDLETKRHEWELKLLQLDEQEYADRQAKQIDDIIAWLRAIITKNPVTLSNNEKISVPKGETPAYLEWIVWRSFLAINSLCNSPWDARRFEIDQDFLPVHCAPGGGPDMIFEFEKAIVVVEVTLTSSSRQEAAEGEPVRRHVAVYTENEGKEVYGLFVALKVDSNTAHTFRSGDWYLADDSKLSLDIVPITLEDFSELLSSAKSRIAEFPDIIRQLLIECRAKANQEAPQWKESISTIINRIANERA